MLNNRELAALIWISAAVLWAFSKTSVRRSFVGVIKAFLKLQILLPLVAMFAWVGLELWVGVRLALWSTALAKATILWTLGSAGVLLFNCTQIDSNGADVHFFRRTILATVGVTAFVEFFVNLYVMSLAAELIFQVVVAVPSVMVAVAGQKPEYKSVKAFCERVLALIGVCPLRSRGTAGLSGLVSTRRTGVTARPRASGLADGRLGAVPIRLQYLCRLRRDLSPHPRGKDRESVTLAIPAGSAVCAALPCGHCKKTRALLVRHEETW